MTVASRTPEGLPSSCPLCGATTNIDFSSVVGDAPCPSCGYLLWSSERLVQFVTKRYEKTFGLVPAPIVADSRFSDLGGSSLDTVELVMEFEGEFDIQISDEDAPAIQTIGDALRYIENYRRGKGD